MQGAHRSGHCKTILAYVYVIKFNATKMMFTNNRIVKLCEAEKNEQSFKKKSRLLNFQFDFLVFLLYSKVERLAHLLFEMTSRVLFRY